MRVSTERRSPRTDQAGLLNDLRPTATAYSILILSTQYEIRIRSKYIGLVIREGLCFIVLVICYADDVLNFGLIQIPDADCAHAHNRLWFVRHTLTYA